MDDKTTPKQRADRSDTAIDAYERLQLARAALEREVIRFLTQLDRRDAVGVVNAIDGLRDLVRVSRAASTDLHHALTTKETPNAIRN